MIKAEIAYVSSCLKTCPLIWLSGFQLSPQIYTKNRQGFQSRANRTALKCISLNHLKEHPNGTLNCTMVFGTTLSPFSTT